MKRKGLGAGKGKGYKNIIKGYDKKVHSDSSKGRKQPQKIQETKFLTKPPKKSEYLFGSDKQITQTNLIEKTINGLDPFERRIFKQNFERTNSFEKSLELLVNEVEGDVSQLSPALEEYAEKKGLLKGFEDSDGDGVPDKDDCDPNDPTKQDNFDATETLRQLGGNRFIAMTGAKNFVKDDKKQMIMFRIPRAKESINVVKIKLTSMDLYDMEFGMMRAEKYTIKKEFKGVYNDQLQDFFTQATGLYTSL